MEPWMIRANLHPGMRVAVIQKSHQRSGEMTEGVICALLTSAPRHTRGIKVRLEGGIVGRVAQILE